MKTERFEVSEENIKKAGEIIKKGGLVAFPTETVYGLGADALNAEAVASIYRAKGRPSDNPMIVHIAEKEQLNYIVTEVSKDAELLIDEFWPGPITFIFHKTNKIPDRTTGGLNTVAIRMPSNIIARALINASNTPIAAPSANLSGKPSPTCYQDVLEDMDGRINAVIKGEMCDVGIESTVLDLTGEVPAILRPGYITKEMIEQVLKKEVIYDKALFMKPEEKNFRPKSPGMKYKHYAPKAEVVMVSGKDRAVTAKIEDLVKKNKAKGKKVAVIDYSENSREAAHDFFTRLREYDREKVDIIIVRALREEGLGFSLMNRMMKSAGYNIIEV